MICFKCKKQFTERGGLLFGVPQRIPRFKLRSSITRPKFHLCKVCTFEVLRFCGVTSLKDGADKD